MAHDDAMVNTSGNRSFSEVLEVNQRRRQILVGGLTTAAASFFASPALAALEGTDSASGAADRVRRSRVMNFRPVSVAEGNGPWPAISEDYQYDVLIPWGEPLEPGGPAWQWPPSAADQAKQIGCGHDGMWFFPMEVSDGLGPRRPFDAGRWRNRPAFRGMLAINHEFGANSHVLGKEAPEGLEDVRASQHAHGVAVVELRKIGQRWQTVESDNARRIHVNTPMVFSGPAADHPLLQTVNGNVPLGTVNNCAGGHTPWGTYLTCEENFNGYFGANEAWSANEAQQRYGFTAEGSGYRWHKFDHRFDLSDPDYQNEENRFGWVVEIDPFDATQTPVKRTALGRLKHEGATMVEGRGGRIVVYMGDDQRFDYIYKFVSADNWRRLRREGKSPLDEGTLYVARFNDDGAGEWLPLTLNNPALAARFADMGELLVNTRLAADIAGATPMDRPEWTTVAPNGDVYCTLTNNSQRTEPNAANPMAPNADGHIIRWRDTNKHIGLKFTWDIFLIAEKTHGTEESFSDPDGVWADPDGRLFIQTDGGQKDGLNNQMLVADTLTGEVRRLFTGVNDCEITGIAITPDRRTMFVNIQHPGDGDPGATNFPAALDGTTVPRDATIVITRKNNGIIGS